MHGTAERLLRWLVFAIELLTIHVRSVFWLFLPMSLDEFQYHTDETVTIGLGEHTCSKLILLCGNLYVSSNTPPSNYFISALSRTQAW